MDLGRLGKSYIVVDDGLIDVVIGTEKRCNVEDLISGLL